MTSRYMLPRDQSPHARARRCIRLDTRSSHWHPWSMPARTARRCDYCVSCTLNEISETSEIFESQTEGCSSGYLFLTQCRPESPRGLENARREFRPPAQGGQSREQRADPPRRRRGQEYRPSTVGVKSVSRVHFRLCTLVKKPAIRWDSAMIGVVVQREAGSPFPREHCGTGARCCARFAV
jgi:hypothetical protein